MADGTNSSGTDSEKLSGSTPSPESSPAPDAKAELDRLKLQLETDNIPKEQQAQRIQEMMDQLYGQKAEAVLRRVETLAEPTDEAKNVLRDGSAILIAEALAQGKEIKSASDLADLYRADSHAANRAFSESLIRIVADDRSTLARWYKNEGWDEAMKEAQDFTTAIRAAKDVVKPDEEKDKSKDDKEKGAYDKTKGFLAEHKSELNTALLLGAAGVGAWFLVKKLFDKKDEGKSESEKTGLATKIAGVALVGAFGAGQLLGMKDVCDWIAHGDHDSWVYGSAARGLAELADLEVGNAFDYWTGNGPSESQRSQFETMSKIFDVSESTLWADSKMSYGDFMDGSAHTFSPFDNSDEDKIRKKLKDSYKTDLERVMPELKDPEKAKNIRLGTVLMKGLASGVIRDKDTTALKEADRQELDARFDEDQKSTEATRTMLQKPQENVAGLEKMSDHLVEQIEQLNGSIDDYWGDMRIAAEDAMGIDTDFGADNEDEYRDLKAARDKFMNFFDEHAKTDHEFFEGKKERVKAFGVFLKKHEKENPWSTETMNEFNDYKEDILDIQQKLLTAKRLAEQENLNQMKKDREDITVEDLTQGLSFGMLGLNGAWDRLVVRMDKVMEGDKFTIALTVAQVAGVASEFVGKPAYTGNWAKSNLCFRVVKGATWDLAEKPLVAVFTYGRDTLKAMKAFQYNAEELTVELLKGRMTPQEVNTRLGYAEDLKAWYELKKLPNMGPLADFKSGQILKMEDLIALKGQLGNVKVMNDFVDGKLTKEQLSGTLRDFINAIPEEKIHEIKAYRLLTRAQTETGSLFNEVLKKIKAPDTVLSAEADIAYKKLNLRADEVAFMQQYLGEPDGVRVLNQIQKIVTPELAYVPEHLRTEGTGANGSHVYKYRKDEISLSQADLEAKATEIADRERAAGRVPAEGETTAWHESNWKMAIDELCAERYMKPVRVSGDTYRMGGAEFKIPASEVQARMAGAQGLSEEQALKQICLERATPMLTVESVEIAGGKYRYKLNGEWLEFEQPIKVSELKEKFRSVLGDKIGDFEKFAAQAKGLKYFAALEKIVGTAGAVWTIWHLETATDKRKATAELAGTMGAFYAGMKLTDWTVGKRRSPIQRVIVDLMGGFAGAYLGGEQIESIVTGWYEKIPAAYGVSNEVASFMEKEAARGVTRTVLISAEEGIIKAGVEKIGMKGLTELLEKRVSSTFLKGVAELAAKQGFRDILGFLGLRGVTTAALLADDATVIGVADDIIAVGMLVWMGKDIYDLLRLISNAQELQKQMEERQKHAITKYEIRGAKARAAFQDKLANFSGATIENAPEKLGEDAFFDILRGIEDVQLVIEREDTLGHEEWTLHAAEAVGMAVYNQDGTVLCEMNNEDAAKLDEDLTKAEQTPKPAR